MTNPKPQTIPVLKSAGMVQRINVTPKWFVDHAEYPPAGCTFQLLINGKRAFSEVYDAIFAAKRSVSIICWGFQPSMYFKRDGKCLSIGALLEQKAKAGIKVRVLSWGMKVELPYYDISVNSKGVSAQEANKILNVTGIGGEVNTPGRWNKEIKGKLIEATKEQYQYDKAWYDLHDDDQETADVKAKQLRIKNGDVIAKNLKFYGRGFSFKDRLDILTSPKKDPNVGAEMLLILSALATHHQKMVLVDYEDPFLATGFVMGHNMIDRYWDTDKHAMTGRPFAPNLGANGVVPREDFSSRVTGPILEYLFKNFAEAWNKKTGEALPLPTTPFKTYKPRVDSKNKALMAQIVRTQPQTKKTDIKKAYLQAVNNATQCIYMENQYFRWPPLADLMLECAKKQTGGGRKPEEHGNLYVFVITNSSDEGMGPGALKTYEMLDKLGRADAMPHVTVLQRYEALGDQLTRQNRTMKKLLTKRGYIDDEVRMLPPGSPGINERYTGINQEIFAAERQKKWMEDQLAQQTKLKENMDAVEGKVEKAGASNKDALTAKKDVLLVEERPGLRVHIATLSASDTQAGQPWVETYIHAKLTIIDDTFMTLGSTNINTRSMETDSELNILHDRPEISQPTRKLLWDLHTKGWPVKVSGLPMNKAFDEWGKIMKENKRRRYGPKQQSPIAPLTAFLRGSPSRKNQD